MTYQLTYNKLLDIW